MRRVWISKIQALIAVIIGFSMPVAILTGYHYSVLIGPPRIDTTSTRGGSFGDGRDGDLLIHAGQTVSLNIVSAEVSASGSNAVPVNSTGFAIGDVVLFHQTQGTSNVGRWEVNQIAAINESNSWTLVRALTWSYTNRDGHAQVIKVPQYRNVTVEAGGVLTALPWDGSVGGISVFMANGIVDIAGQVAIVRKDFKAGDESNAPITAHYNGSGGGSYASPRGNSTALVGAGGGGGGAIFNDQGTIATFGGGGGIYIDRGTPTIQKSNINTNGSYYGEAGGVVAIVALDREQMGSYAAGTNGLGLADIPQQLDPLIVLLKYLLRQILSLGSSPSLIDITPSNSFQQTKITTHLLIEDTSSHFATIYRHITPPAPRTRRYLNYFLFGGRYHCVGASCEDSWDPSIASIGSSRSIAPTSLNSIFDLAMLLLLIHLHRVIAPGGIYGYPLGEHPPPAALRGLYRAAAHQAQPLSERGSPPPLPHFGRRRASGWPPERDLVQADRAR